MEDGFTGLEELTKLHLTELDLSRNVLLEVPLAIGRLFKLRQLNLSRNQIR
uniref:Uncharacterized protein n=1 Tax=Parascaris equorum TaxID=6256 RepID=A0A914REK4_PAREQ